MSRCRLTVIRARTLDTLRQLAVKGSQRRPIIFAVEDAHWIDRPSEEYFDSLMEDLPGTPILFVATYLALLRSAPTPLAHAGAFA